MVTLTTGPWRRLESLAPSGATSRGRWANWGGETGSAEGLENQQVLEGVGEVILAADDVADAEIGVVSAGGEVIGGLAVRTQQGEVFDLVGELGLRAVDGVGEAQSTAVAARDAIAEGEGLAAAARRSLSSLDSSRMPGLKSHAPCGGGLVCRVVAAKWAGVKSR